MIDPYLPVIEQWLAEDRANWRKQRHTATRIWEQLREHGAEVSLSTVTRAVARAQGVSSRRSVMRRSWIWYGIRGEGAGRFRQVDVLLRGVVQRMHHFVLDFPYSNVGLVQLMPGENAECTCAGVAQPVSVAGRCAGADRVR